MRASIGLIGHQLRSVLFAIALLALGACHADYCGLADTLPSSCASSILDMSLGECRDQLKDNCTIDESLALVSYVECIDTEITQGASCEDDESFDTLMSCVNELKPVDPLCLTAVL